MGEASTVRTDPEESESPRLTPPQALPSVTVSRGLIGVPDFLRFWRRGKATVS